MIYCPVCGTANRHGSKYCNECGVKFDPLLQVKCPACGASNPAADSLCNACGKALSSPPEVFEPTDPGPEDEIDTPVTVTDGHGMPSWLEGMPSSLIDEIQKGTDSAKGAPAPGQRATIGPGAEAGDVLGTGARFPEIDPVAGTGTLREETGLRSTGQRAFTFTRKTDLLDGIPGALQVGVLVAQPGKEIGVTSGSAASRSLEGGVDEAASLELPRLFSQIVAPSGEMPEETRLQAEEGDTAATHDQAGSLLALDCGGTRTHVFLIDQVEGQYRVIARGEAPSTMGAPWNDMTVAVRLALDQIAKVTGQRMLDDSGQPAGPEPGAGGVGGVVTTTSAGDPLRLLVAGAPRGESLDRVRSALALACPSVEILTRQDSQKGDAPGTEAKDYSHLLQELVPDALVLVGGIDGGGGQAVLESVQAVAAACDALPAATVRPSLIYAGDASLQAEVAGIVGTRAELQMVDNILPRAGTEQPGPLQAAVKELHRQKWVNDLPGFGTLSAWNSVPATPATAAFVHTTQYLARRRALFSDEQHAREPRSRGPAVLAVDVGGTTTTAAVVVGGLLDLVVRKDLGLSHSATSILDHVPPDSVLGWLPFPLDPVEVHNSLHSKTEHPHTLPQTRQDLFLEQAVAREILRLVRSALADGRHARSDLVPDSKTQFDLIVGSGGVLVNAPDPGQAALVLIDGLQPVGICNLVLDRFGLMAAVGALAEACPLAAVQVAERDLLRRLGTVVAPVGVTREGETALTCKIEYSDGRALDLAVPYGSMEVLPLPAGQWATLRVQPTGRFEVGSRGRGRPITTKVEGGAVGVIIDARGRPLQRAKDPEVQQARNQHWLWHIGSPAS